MDMRFLNNARRKLRAVSANLRLRGEREEDPLRAELYSLEQLEKYARFLAKARSNSVNVKRGKDKLLPRLEANRKLLVRIHKLITLSVQENRRIAPAAEWLLDNFYLIEEQIRTIHDHFPRSYSRELPRLTKGPLSGFPRVYEIAFHIISHNDGRVDNESLSAFVEAYQSVTPLKLGELWAIPIMIRLALIENLRRIAFRVGKARQERDSATSWAERMISVAEKEPDKLIMEIADMAREDPPLTEAFVAELTRRLQGQSSALALPISWMEQRLLGKGASIERLVQIEGQKQAQDQVSVSNTVNSLRTLGAIDWRDFVDHMSVVEKVLRQDPYGAYGKMDFATRDRYRHVIEAVSKRTAFQEEDVAVKAISLAGGGSTIPRETNRKKHVGFFLVEDGYRDLVRETGLRLSIMERVCALGRRFPMFFYLAAASGFTIIAALTAISRAYFLGAKGFLLLFSGILTVFCCARFGLALTNWLVTLIVAPRKLGRMDFTEGIHPECKTVAVVPAIVNDEKAVDVLIDDMEVRYLANRDRNLYFGLLTDFADASEKVLPQDQELLEKMTLGIKMLNERYGTEKEDRFFLFHRPRIWNDRENVWMAWERKRGKLFELNMFLRGKGFLEEEGYLVVGNTEQLRDVKYVITLDTDTHMPLGSARELVATMAHPLNKAVYDDKKGIVTEGYGILQPRVEVSMASAGKSRFVKLFTGDPGIDPYTQIVSDVYQDVFGEGSFIGKGIYDVDIFMVSMKDRFPDEMILSHDLLEGSYARSGLVSDIQFFEEYPSSYSLEVNRKHRWIRGDWQILEWLLPHAPSRTGQRIRNPISFLSKWKIFDNLRRSLVPPAMLALLVTSWMFIGDAVFWTMFVAGIVIIPQIFVSVMNAARKPSASPFFAHLRSEIVDAIRRALQSVFFLMNLVFEAFIDLDAAFKAIVRVYITRRKTLEWVTSSDMKRRAHPGFMGFWESMWMAPAASMFIAGGLYVIAPSSLAGAAPLLVLWLLSPTVSWMLSRKIPVKKVVLSSEKERFLRIVARRTWRFFEDFISAENNWLVPDNYQEGPTEIVARRTSPTNMGMALLSDLTACDLRYVSGENFLNRAFHMLESMKKLKRFRGNFYNWYDISTFEPLNPLYVSSVDSGNMAGALLVFRQGIQEMRYRPVIPNDIMKGVKDTWAVLGEEIEKATALSGGIVETFSEIGKELDKVHVSPGDARESLLKIRDLSGFIRKEGSPERISEIKWWAGALESVCSEWIGEIDILLPGVLFDPTGYISDETFPGMERLAEDLREEFIKILRPQDLNALAMTDTGKVRKLAREFCFPHGASSEGSDKKYAKMEDMISAVEKSALFAAERISRIEEAAVDCAELADMEFDFLYDKSYNLLSIGYNVIERRRDQGCYDLLASEARLASFIGISSGSLPEEHWFSLGRLFTSGRSGGAALLSWGGSMFEYLMPLLIMPNYDNTLLDATYKAVVRKHMRYASGRGLSYWGISESGYNATDAHMNYQYRSFGVPDLGFKRGLADDLVIAPYASVMALMVFPEKACENMRRMKAKGFFSKYGFYEAADHTPARRPHGQAEPALVKSFMAHHQGMSFLSLAYVLLDKPMQRRFLADPSLHAAEPLLHERLPKATPFHRRLSEPPGISRSPEEGEPLFRVFTNPNTSEPEVHLLSNGAYNVMVTNSGSGYTRWKGLAVTRWSEDTTKDDAGSFCYIRDVSTGEIWSAGYHPTRKRPEHYEAIFPRGKAEFRRIDGEIETHTQIAVSPEDDMELRRVKIVNASRETRTIELTSYMEVVLAPGPADSAHPAFSKLFVETEIMKAKQAILCSRRKRSENDEKPYMYHLAAIHGTADGEASYETDRAKFIGRGGDLAMPTAMKGARKLSGSEGAVLDPIVSIRCRLIIEPEQSAVVDFVTGMTENREKALEFVEKYRDRHLADRVFDLAWTHSQVVLQQSNADETDAQIFGRLAGSIVYPGYSRRASSSVVMKNRRSQSGLWGYSVSGDLPIVLVKISDQANIDLIRQIFKAHIYWRMKGLVVDLVIWNEDHSGYRQDLHDRIMGMVTAGMETHFLDKPGGVFVRKSEQMSEEDKILFQTVARVIISDTRGTLEEQIEPRAKTFLNIPRLITPRLHFAKDKSVNVKPTQDLLFFNGKGGFTVDGREYVISMDKGDTTPAPWVNVIANPFFGTVISESGSAFTWRENSGQFRLTPWSNDPVKDTSGEAIYIRDEETGKFWSPSPFPARGNTSYVARHGCGYSVFEHCEEGILTELWVYVAMDAAVKYSVMKIKNVSGRTRKLSVTYYTEPVLGESRSVTQMHVVTEIDPKTGGFFARNRYNPEFGEYTAFVDIDLPEKCFTGDRAEFIGRNGTLSSPAAMKRSKLSNTVGASVDPCAAVQAKTVVSDGQEIEAVIVLGAGRNTNEARELASRHRGAMRAKEAIEKVWTYWNHMLGAVYVDTPDPSVNVMANSWLLYQTLSCRLWAKSAFYQSGGAFGFRDQLQDAMALVHASPEILREQIVRAASRQFKEGDVQHWWHEPTGAGVRTRFSDDFMWLPLAVARYIKTTADKGILDENIRFLEGRPVNDDEDAYYDKPILSEETATLYEHCVRAIKKGLTSGRHGLPLMGTGDWNDGMSRVGAGGEGESVWLAFFIYHVVSEFMSSAGTRDNEEFEKFCEAEKERLSLNLDKHCWDGKWYLRAFYDNGEPMGSSRSEECRIDSLPQSWAVISSAGDKRRAGVSMEQVYRHLVRKEDSLIQLFDPPFDKTPLDPGYIKGYPPGIRENGGQYTHAAVWVAMAFAAMGDRERAWELFRMLNPVNHSIDRTSADRYKGEPYVMPADVYSTGAHTGRAGWTWYTGSAGWMYRFLLEDLLGIALDGCALKIKPCVPEDWKGYVVHYRFRETVYHISFERMGLGREVRAITLDGMARPDLIVPLIDDHVEHDVRVELGSP